MPPFVEAEAVLRARGFKITPQRRLLLRVLDEQSAHLDAEELYRLAYAQDASISLATVYRALSLFADLGLIDHRYVEPEHRREVFRLSRGPEQHYLLCVRCGARVQIHTDLLDRMVTALVQREGVSVIGACACFTGYCPACAGELRGAGLV